MKVAVVQTNATEDRARNVGKALGYVRRAAVNKAKFVLLPEAFSFRGRVDAKTGYSKIAERVPGPSIKPFLDEAKKYGIFILAGSVCEKIPGSKKVYNTSVLISPKGAITAKYRKNNLFDAVIGGKKLKESERFRAGQKTTIASVGAWKLGMSICYDVRFPGMYRRYAGAGAHLFCVPSAFTKTTGKAHWETLLRARAIENLCYVLAPNQIGKDGRGVPNYGHSLIIDPWGKVLARASGVKEEIIYARLEMSVLKRCRSILPGRKK